MPAGTPGSTSGTSNFFLSNAQIVLEAAERTGTHDLALVRDKLPSLQISQNLELQRFGAVARGPSLWKMEKITVPLVTGQPTYILDPDILTITEMWYTTVNGNGAGQDSDRIMVPITRTQYAMIPNKLNQGDPTQYWFQKLAIPQFTIWNVPSQGAPTYELNMNVLRRIQDANMATGEYPDIVYRALDALCAALAVRFVPKLVPRAEWVEALSVLKPLADLAWDDFTADDQEVGALSITPNVGGYGRMR